MTTRQALIDATVTTLRLKGIAGLSARAVAAEAGVNQALVFYHFGSVDELVVAACRESADARVADYRARFAAVTSLSGLLALSRDLRREEADRGNVTVMAQVLAGAQHDERLRAGAREALGLWVDQVEQVLERLLRDSPVAEALDVPGLARATTAAFVGVELYDGVDPAGADAGLAALEQLAVLVDVADDLGQAARIAVRRRLRRATRS